MFETSSAATQQARLGQQIRLLRREQGLTLVALATLTRLSHPFLSQLERGLARPSMNSLERIATALHSSQSELMARAVDSGLPAGPPFTVVRADGGTELPAPGGSARLLVGAAARFHPMVYVGSNVDFEEYYRHPEDEFVHVMAGSIEVDLGDRKLELAAGDSLYYLGGTPHRWRNPGGSGYRLLAVKEAPAAAVRERPGTAQVENVPPAAGPHLPGNQQVENVPPAVGPHLPSIRRGNSRPAPG